MRSMFKKINRMKENSWNLIFYAFFLSLNSKNLGYENIMLKDIQTLRI